MTDQNRAARIVAGVAFATATGAGRTQEALAAQFSAVRLEERRAIAEWLRAGYRSLADAIDRGDHVEAAEPRQSWLDRPD